MSGVTNPNIKIEMLDDGTAESAGELCGLTLRWAWERYLKAEYPKEAIEFDIESLSGKELQRRLKDRDHFAFVAKDGDKISGIVQGRLFGNSGFALFNWVAVHPDYQHQGVGIGLLMKAEEHLSARGVHKMSLYTFPALQPAIKLFMKFGMQPEAYLRNQWWGSDYLMMSRWTGEYRRRTRDSP